MAVVPTAVLPALSQRMLQLSQADDAYPDCETSTAKALVDLLIKNVPVPLPFEVVVVAGLANADKIAASAEQLDMELAKQVSSVLVCCRYFGGSRGLSCYPFCSVQSCPILIQSLASWAFSSAPRTPAQAAFSEQACSVTLCSFPRSLAPYLSSIPCYPKGESPCHLLRFSGTLSQLKCSSTQPMLAEDLHHPQPSVTVGPLMLEHAPLVDSMWTYHAPHTLSIMQHIISSGNSCAVFVDGQPVSWALRTAYGSIGMLHTLKHFRRRGYAAAVVRGLACKIIQDGGVPFCHIVEGNASSLSLFHAIGFAEPYPGERFDWYHLLRQAE
jgi:hypothetical protein